MAIKNKDVIKRVGTKNLAKILGCSESTINSWAKKGLGVTQYNLSTFNDIAKSKINSFNLDIVKKWLEENKKEKYLLSLEAYLDTDYMCRLCKNKVAELESDSQGYICKECDKNYNTIK